MEGRLTFYCVRMKRIRSRPPAREPFRNRCSLPSSEKIAFAKFAFAVCVRVYIFLGIEVVQYPSIHAARIVFAASILETTIVIGKKKGKENRRKLYTCRKRKREI